uniref:Sin3a_C domain-containing protein n=1 Tax=Steinernema glaseri TaxID=37863 RepID=A0A1I8AH37_9BILA
MRRALKQLYGEQANKMLEGLMYLPNVTVPRVLTRMREKQQEWTNSQAALLEFSDMKMCMQAAQDDRQVVLVYNKDRDIIYDVNDLIIHHVERLPNLREEEKRLLVKMYTTLLELFGPLSDDEETTAGEEDAGEKVEEKASRRPVTFAERNKGVESHGMNAADTNRGLLLLKPPLQSPKYFYKKVLDSVKNLLDGQMESSAFHESMRSMFGTRAYLAFTIDKHIQQMGRYLQQMINDQTNTKCLELYQKMKPAVPRPLSKLIWAMRRAKKNYVSMSYMEMVYHTRAILLLRNKICFKMLYVNTIAPTIKIKYLNTEYKAGQYMYVLEYIQEEVPAGFDETELAKSVFLRRNLTKANSRPTLKDDKVRAHYTLQASLQSKIKFVAGSFDLLFRQSARQRASARQHMSAIHRNNAFRTFHKKFIDEHKDSVDSGWFLKNCVVYGIHCDKFPYLKFKKYFSKPNPVETEEKK